MGVTKNYSRPKASAVNNTGIDLILKGSEQPDPPADLGGTTGIADLMYTADADESGGVDVQDLGGFTVTPAIDPDTGKITFTVVFTPVKGNGDPGDAVTQVFTHPETMDAWQTAAGRARQA